MSLLNASPIEVLAAGHGAAERYRPALHEALLDVNQLHSIHPGQYNALSGTLVKTGAAEGRGCLAKTLAADAKAGGAKG